MKLEQAIYYLHVSELRAVCVLLELEARGEKRELVNRVMAVLRGRAPLALLDKGRILQKKARDEVLVQKYELHATLLPGLYTNGREARSFLVSQVGPHFRFTVFGMDWIRRQWARGLTPTFSEFIAFWTTESKARESGKAFDVAPSETGHLFSKEIRCQSQSKSQRRAPVVVVDSQLNSGPRF
jgi:hypothetical protein